MPSAGLWLLVCVCTGCCAQPVGEVLVVGVREHIVVQIPRYLCSVCLAELARLSQNTVAGVALCQVDSIVTEVDDCSTHQKDKWELACLCQGVEPP